MEKRTREILALVLLVVLGIGIGCAMAWYIMVGHNWNITATHIDDYVGEMEGYTVIVYEGTTPLPAMTGVGQMVSAQLDDEAGEARSDSSSSANSDSNESEEVAGASSESASSSSASSSSSSTSALSDDEQVHVSVKDVAKSYREKDASVLVIDSRDIAKYEDPQILKRGDNRIGVFAIGSGMPYVDFVRKVTYLKRHDVDSIVCITNDRTFSSLRFHGADIVIFACNAFIPSNGTSINGAFCADSPNVGEVQAVIISPSKVVSTKAIAKL